MLLPGAQAEDAVAAGNGAQVANSSSPLPGPHLSLPNQPEPEQPKAEDAPTLEAVSSEAKIPENPVEDALENNIEEIQQKQEVENDAIKGNSSDQEDKSNSQGKKLQVTIEKKRILN